jgi:hypothetical protein
VTKLAQIAARFHDGREPVGGGIRRAVIDIDDFIGPSAVERGRDFRDQRCNIVGLVAHGNNDRDSNGLSVGQGQFIDRFDGFAAPLLWGGWSPGNPFAAFYGCPGRGNMAPSWPTPKPMPLAANQ